LPNDGSVDIPPHVPHLEITSAELNWIQQEYDLQISHYDSPTFSSEPFSAQAAGVLQPQSAVPGYTQRTRIIYIPPCGNCGGARCGNFGKVLHVTDR
jgi:hypothetical protein